MKKYRLLNVFALIVNLMIVGFGIYSLVAFLKIPGNQADIALLYPSLFSFIACVVSLVNIPFNIVGIMKMRPLPSFAFIAKMVAASAAFIGIYLSLLPVFEGKLSDDIFSFSDLSQPNLYLYLIIPVLSLLSAAFLDHSRQVKFPFVFIAAAPGVIYFSYYLIARKDTYGDLKDWKVYAAIAIAIVGAVILAILVWLINKFVVRKDEAVIEEEPKPVDEKPVGEEKVEEVKEQVYVIKTERVEEAPEEPAKEEKAEEVKEAPAPKKEAPKKAPAKKPAAKPAPKKAAPAKKPAAKPAASKESDTKVYHLTKRKEDGMWAITFVGGQKAVKLFKTKKEAEEHLATLTKNQGATALIRNSKGAKAGKFASSIKSEE